VGQLEELSLAGIPLGDERAALFAGSERWMNLRKLDLSRSGLVDDDGVYRLAQSPHLGNLVELRLRGAGGSNHVGNLVASPHLTRLRVLDLRDSSCPTGGWVRKFADSPMADSLRELRLPPLPMMQGQGLLDVRRLSGLQVLDLHGYTGGGDVAIHLARASHLRQLRELVLSKCQLGSDGLAALAKAPHLASLTHLDLSGNWIGAHGFTALIGSPHLANLRRLVVRGNPGAQGADGRRLIDHFGADVCEGVTA
jgi:hypothetical protein